MIVGIYSSVLLGTQVHTQRHTQSIICSFLDIKCKRQFRAISKARLGDRFIILYGVPVEIYCASDSSCIKLGGQCYIPYQVIR